MSTHSTATDNNQLLHRIVTKQLTKFDPSTMIYRNSAVAILVGCSCSVTAFNYTPHPQGSARLPCSLSELHESLDSSGDRFEAASSSRRSVLHHCAHVFAATAFAWNKGRDAAFASEFFSGIDDPAPHRSNDSALPNVASIISTNPQVEKHHYVQQDLSRGSSSRDVPQFTSESVQLDIQQNAAQETIQLSAVMPASSSLGMQVTLENSQVITIPTKQVPVAFQSSNTPATTSSYDKPVLKQQNNGIALAFELSITTIVLGAVGKAVSGKISSNTDELTTKAKVVMVENEPYGLAKGRRYYNGIDITRNDPVPASDVLKYCDAGKVNNDCAELITDFLGEVQGNSKRGFDGPSIHQKETATAVLSYLDTLSSSRDASSKTTEAFSSYLNGLSNGEVEAPASPQAVAGYLESLNEAKNGIAPSESNSQQFQGDMTRLIETFLISSDGYGEEENVYGEYGQANGSRMQLDTVP